MELLRDKKFSPKMPLKGSSLNSCVWLVIKNRDTLLVVRPPTETISLPLRRVTTNSVLLCTGLTPIPVPNTSVMFVSPSWNVELFEELNWTWLLQASPHSVP